MDFPKEFIKKNKKTHKNPMNNQLETYKKNQETLIFAP